MLEDQVYVRGPGLGWGTRFMLEDQVYARGPALGDKVYAIRGPGLGYQVYASGPGLC